MYACMYTYVCMYACMYACIYVCVCMHIIKNKSPTINMHTKSAHSTCRHSPHMYIKKKSTRAPQGGDHHQHQKCIMIYLQAIIHSLQNQPTKSISHAIRHKVSTEPVRVKVSPNYTDVVDVLAVDTHIWILVCAGFDKGIENCSWDSGLYPRRSGWMIARRARG
jgi:hypothetical protein